MFHTSPFRGRVEMTRAVAFSLSLLLFSSLSAIAHLGGAGPVQRVAPKAGGRTTATTPGLYASRAGGSSGELFRIDPTTGGLLQDIGPLNDANGINYPMTALAFHPVTGVLYGSTSGSSGVSDLAKIDPATGLVTLIGPYGGSRTMSDLAFTTTGVLYGIRSDIPNLYQIDLSTGAATLVGSWTGSGSTVGGGLAINSSNAAFGTPQSNMYGTYNLATGVYTNITNPTKPLPSGTYAALAFDQTDVLYGINLTSSASGGQTHLVKIDPATGTVTDIGQSIAHIDGIAFLASPTAANVAVSGRVTDGYGNGLRNARVAFRDNTGQVRTAVTNSFGYYTFIDLPTGINYIANVSVRGYTFAPRIVAVYDQITDLNFTPE